MRKEISVLVALLVIAACAHQAPTTAAPMSSASASGGEELTSGERVRQTLNRLTFGPRPGDADAVASMGVERWIDVQLSPSRIDDAAADAVLASLETQRKKVFELIADHPDPQELQQRINQRAAQARANPTAAVPVAFSNGDSLMVRRAQQTIQQLTGQIVTAKLVRAVASERQLQEVMTDFWENHFSVFIGKSPSRFSMVEYDRDVIRPRALGHFRDLLGAVAKSPQMLFYLDNWQSGVDSAHPNILEQRIEARRASATDPLVQSLATLPRRRPRGLNENYARELMELHTLGVDGGYTQKDVQEVARALTGWTIDTPNLGGGFVFRPEQHDAGEKVVLGRPLPAGRGIEDGEEVLDILTRAPATARFITTKLARHFVSDDPPPALVDRCAKTFSRTEGDIGETMRCLVTSHEFFSRAAYRAKVKTPFELVASSLRALGAPPDTTPRSAQLVNQLGQPIFGRLTPDGWPDRGEAWMNSGAIMNRINFGFRLAAGQIPGVRIANWAPAARLRELPYDKQVDGVISELLGGGVSDDTRRILLSGENPLMNAGASVPKTPVPQLTGLPAIVALALGTPEFQKR
jgi:uncharacterized protein (DUF1800 family)